MPDVKGCGLFISRLLLIMFLGLADSCPAAMPEAETKLESTKLLTIAGSRDLPPFSWVNPKAPVAATPKPGGNALPGNGNASGVPATGGKSEGKPAPEQR